MSAKSVTRSLAGALLFAALAAGCATAASHPTTPHHAAPPVVNQAPVSPAGSAAHAGTPQPKPTHASPVPAAPTPAMTNPTPSQPAPAKTTPAPAKSTNPIPQNNGGDHDGDNSGGPSDGDGNI